MMQEFWTKMSESYGKATDLEEKQRMLLAAFLKDKKGKLIELACGNGKVIEDILSQNQDLEIMGVDYNVEMIEVAKRRVPQASFHVGDILQIDGIVGDQKFDFVVCLNSIHNLPDKLMIYHFFEAMKRLSSPDGYIIFDIRNSWNPFVAYGYWKNRRKGLQFHTLNKYTVLQLFKKDFKIVEQNAICYESLRDAGKDSVSFLFRLAYRLYFLITRISLFAPYQFIILQKK